MPTQTDSKKAAKDAAKLAKGVVHLAILVDESGSMQGREESVVTGVNEFIHSFRESKGKVTATLSFFDSHPGAPRVRIRYAAEKVSKVADLKIGDYNPRGMTPLNDAVIETVEAMDKRVGKKERAFVVIITDGMENASEVKDPDVVAKLIAKREADGWAFLYLGTDNASHAAAANLGIKKKGSSLMFSGSKVGTQTAFASASRMASSYAATQDVETFDKTRSAVSDSYGDQLGEDDAAAFDEAMNKAEEEAQDDE